MAKPTNWPTVRLGDHCSLLTGFPFKSAKFTYDHEDVALVKGSNVHQGFIDWKSDVRWPRDDMADYDEYRLKVHDVVLAMDRPWIEAGLKFAWIRREDPEGLLVQRVARLRGTNGLRSDFLRYVIGSPRFEDYIRPIVTGVNVPHISPQQIRDFRFDLPPTESQGAIASILVVYDDVIENNARRIKILEEMARALYREWFVRPLESGSLPEGWTKTRVDEVATIYRGKSYRGQELVAEGGLPFLNLKCVNRDGGFRHDGVKRFIGEFQDRHTAKAGDVVVAVTDMTQERRIVAHAARVPMTAEPLYVMSMDLVRVAPKSRITTAFLYAMLRYSGFPDDVKQHANGVNVLHLNPERIQRFEFALPGEPKVRAFSDICQVIFEQCDLLSLMNANLQRTRDLLLPRLISGEIDVSSLKIEAEAVPA